METFEKSVIFGNFVQNFVANFNFILRYFYRFAFRAVLPNKKAIIAWKMQLIQLKYFDR